MLFRFFLQQKQWARLLGVHGGQHLPAVGAEEPEVPFAHFGRRPGPAQGRDSHGHGQVVAQAAQ